MASVLLVILMFHGHSALGSGTTYQMPVLPESATITLDETGFVLSQGKQRLSEDATPPSRLYHGLQKAETPLKSITFIVPVDEVIPPYAARAPSNGCFIKYFSFSIRPQAP